MLEEEKPPCVGSTKSMYPTTREKGYSVVALDLETEMTKKICATCFRIEECLQDALEQNERHGIWGGINFGNRVERANFLKEIKKNKSLTMIANRTRNLLGQEKAS